MIIRPYTESIETVNDIRNIEYVRRLLILYKYPNPHMTELALYNNEVFDVYLINVSALHGADYIVPKGVLLETKNSYRGVALNALLPDGSINRNATVNFNNGYFASRIRRDRDRLKLIKADSLYGAGTLSEEFICTLRSEIMLPLPNYYNMEDQARLAPNRFTDIDFDVGFSDVPSYILGELVDHNTRVVTMHIDDDNFIGGRADINRIYGPYSDMNDDYDYYRKAISMAFIKVYEIVIASIFSQVYVVFDTESGTFSIDQKTLRLRYGRRYTPADITREFADMVMKVSPIADYDLEILFPYTPSPLDPAVSMTPTRVMFFISDTKCSIHLAAPNQPTSMSLFDMDSFIKTNAQYSGSDSDEFSLKYAADGLMPYEYSGGGLI